mmetsp:Transcript_26187/g.74429  ORF Transcript_26187/g.74429 Transcript_26187/m.74429 type:complete len:378 (-) Transcript_26187:63-1196(-)
MIRPKQWMSTVSRMRSHNTLGVLDAEQLSWLKRATKTLMTRVRASAVAASATAVASRKAKQKLVLAEAQAPKCTAGFKRPAEKTASATSGRTSPMLAAALDNLMTMAKSCVFDAADHVPATASRSILGSEFSSSDLSTPEHSTRAPAAALPTKTSRSPCHRVAAVISLAHARSMGLRQMSENLSATGRKSRPRIAAMAPGMWGRVPRAVAARRSMSLALPRRSASSVLMHRATLTWRRAPCRHGPDKIAALWCSAKMPHRARSATPAALAGEASGASSSAGNGGDAGTTGGDAAAAPTTGGVTGRAALCAVLRPCSTGSSSAKTPAANSSSATGRKTSAGPRFAGLGNSSHTRACRVRAQPANTDARPKSRAARAAM